LFLVDRPTCLAEVRGAVTRRNPLEGAAEQIARQIRSEIEAGVLRDGQALPSTRQLARDWGVSANTALSLLAAEGLVR
jgi:DNA-binding GntR family transcriptional regulator